MSTDGHRLDGRVAWVTGGAGGIGAGIAQVLADAGARVVIADIDEEAARWQAEALASAGHGALGVRIDVADEASVVAGCARALSSFGPPWALVNNAGVQDRALLLDGTAA